MGNSIELHFYPGQNSLVVMEKGAVKGQYEAWGGPEAIGTDPHMAEQPTWPGLYYIDKAHAYRTPTWGMSNIKWGTKLKDMKALNDVYYQLSNGKWASVKNDYNIKRDEIRELHLILYQEKSVPSTWIFNDFGPIAIRWFKDLNGNKILDGKETLSGQMFHTTPENEAQHAQGKPVKMTPSHGCIHLKPVDRDLIFSMGGFKPKTPFIVHKYHERFYK